MAMVIEEFNVGTVVGKVRKGKNFVVQEDKQMCISFFHVSQDPITRNGQKNQAFWEQIVTYYNNTRLLVKNVWLEAWRPSGVSSNMMWPNFMGIIICSCLKSKWDF
jgi:hypothetical protein